MEVQPYGPPDLHLTTSCCLQHVPERLSLESWKPQKIVLNSQSMCSLSLLWALSFVVCFSAGDETQDLIHARHTLPLSCNPSPLC